MNQAQQLKTFEMYLRVRNSSEDTIKRYLQTVQDFMSVVGNKPTYSKKDAIAYLERLVNRKTGGTYRRYAFYCLKTFFASLVIPWPQVKGEIPKLDVPTRRWYRFEEITKILDAALRTSLRDWLLMRILVLTMGRRKSAVVLRRIDYDQATGVITMPSVKGSGTYPVELDAETKKALDGYLLHRTDTYIALLPSSRPARRQGHMTPHTVNSLLRTYAELAGVEYKGVHAFRRGMATYYSRRGLNVKEIMALGPWKSEKQVLAYIQLDPEFAGSSRKALHPFFKETNVERPPSKDRPDSDATV